MVASAAPSESLHSDVRHAYGACRRHTQPLAWLGSGGASDRHHRHIREPSSPAIPCTREHLASIIIAYLCIVVPRLTRACAPALCKKSEWRCLHVLVARLGRCARPYIRWQPSLRRCPMSGTTCQEYCNLHSQSAHNSHLPWSTARAPACARPYARTGTAETLRTHTCQPHLASFARRSNHPSCQSCVNHTGASFGPAEAEHRAASVSII